MPELCVVHLVRESNGLEPFQLFIRSYREQVAGEKHSLVLILKGFSEQRLSVEQAALLEGLNYYTLFVDDRGFDVAPYFAVARAFDCRFFCFLNSYSRILDDGWLAKLFMPISREGVGLVGASGSYESYYTNLARIWQPSASRYRLRRLAQDYISKRAVHLAQAHFDPFPNPHIRTNAFMVRRETMLNLKVGKIKTKMDALKFESGKMGLTKQVEATGLRALVAGRDGEAYSVEAWRESNTFRSGDQSNLLVADNRTEQYAKANPGERQALEAYAWAGNAGD